MISRVLVANRGEIALRIIRACKESGIQSVAAYSRVDCDQPYLRYADEAVCISASSYLDIPSMVAAATSRRCDAVHPGYGLLSENADFVDALEAAGIVFVGPRAETMRVMGDKVAAKAAAMRLGFTTIPGSDGAVDTAGQAVSVAREIGFPVLVKAAFGGGGRGMRVAASEEELRAGFDAAASEASASFGNGALYIERLLADARHIEIQVAGDGTGNAVHLGSRDCSVQRHHQKLIEEAPAQGLESREIDALSEQCAKAARELGYRGVGTFEFLYSSGEFYFIEMNTRLQVEHPVTEAVTGLDLVKMQLEIAMTGRLSMQQRDLQIAGHAIECRINAEEIDMATGKLAPSPGVVTHYAAPGGPGVRVDTHLANDLAVSHFYDSLLGKVIGFGRDRAEALARIDRAMKEISVKGIDTNLPLLRTIVDSDTYREGSVSTTFLDAHLQDQRRTGKHGVHS